MPVNSKEKNKNGYGLEHLCWAKFRACPPANSGTLYYFILSPTKSKTVWMPEASRLFTEKACTIL